MVGKTKDQGVGGGAVFMELAALPLPFSTPRPGPGALQPTEP